MLVAFGCGGERDQAKRAEMGKIAARLADLVIVTDDNPRHEDPEEIAAAILGGVQSAGGRGRRIASRSEAIRQLLVEAGADDGILVAGKGHETTQDFGNERVAFDDREVLRNFLTGRGEPA